MDALANGLKRSIAPGVRRLDSQIAKCKNSQQELTNTVDKTAQLIERVRAIIEEEEEGEGEEDGERGDFLSAKKKIEVAKEKARELRRRIEVVREREREQRKRLLSKRRCDFAVVRANETNECDFEAMLVTAAYVRR